MTTHDLLEFVNPPKLCFALWLREHVLALRNFDVPRDIDDSGSSRVLVLSVKCFISCHNLKKTLDNIIII
jgi:hypothetical protein